MDQIELLVIGSVGSDRHGSVEGHARWKRLDTHARWCVIEYEVAGLRPLGPDSPVCASHMPVVIPIQLTLLDRQIRRRVGIVPAGDYVTDTECRIDRQLDLVIDRSGDGVPAQFNIPPVIDPDPAGR
ncbi:hypothetical protein ACFL44_03750, partial [Gemmatimonadota bacterium]